MNISEFLNKFKSAFLWLNIAGMVLVVAALIFALKMGLNVYTRHGQAIEVPNVVRVQAEEARAMLTDAGLIVEVADTGYNKYLPADCILEQKPKAGAKVKEGHVITLIVNASSTPTLVLPDIVENCSMREAMARLKSMGFKVGDPIRVAGERDWVYGILVDGRQRYGGDRVAVNKMVYIQVGSGAAMFEDADTVTAEAFQEVDEFEEVE